MNGATMNTLYISYFIEHNTDDEPHDRNNRLAWHSVKKIQVPCDGTRIFLSVRPVSASDVSVARSQVCC